MRISISLRRVAAILVALLSVLTAAGIAAEVSRYVLGSKSPLLDFLSLAKEKNIPTWWSSLLLMACSTVLFAIAATKSRALGEFKRHWTLLAVIFCYLSIDECVEVHEWLNEVPALVELHGPLYYGWVVPAAFVVLAFALSYLKFLFHLPRRARILVGVAGALFVGGALGVEVILGMWTETHDEDNLVWEMIDSVEESMEMMGSSLFFYALLEYVGRTAPDLGISIEDGRN